MDIDAMKKNWDALNERLENRETVNNEAIKKLLSQKQSVATIKSEIKKREIFMP